MNIISIHLFPHEVEEYKRIIYQLDSVLKNNHEVEINSVLNINKKVIKESCEFENQIKKFNLVSSKYSGKIKHHVTTKYFGVNEHRRTCINDADLIDTLFFLDTDIYFNDNLIDNFLKELQSIKSEYEYYVITPEVVRLWDSTWDVIVNKKYKKEKIGFYKNIDIDKILKENNLETRSVKCNKFKWAGGWFTCMSAKLAKYIGIPDSFVGYGHDDTFMMYCCEYMKSKQIKVQQFTLSNNIICEDRNLVSKNRDQLKIKDFRQRGDRHMNLEYNKFKKRINDDIYIINES